MNHGWQRDWRWVAPHWRLWLKRPLWCFRVWSGTDGTYKKGDK